MRQYHATIMGDRWPVQTTVEASSLSTAAARAMKHYQSRFKGKRLPLTVSIKLVAGPK